MLKRLFNYILPVFLGLIVFQFLFLVTPVFAQEPGIFADMLDALGIEEAGTAGLIAMVILIARFFAKIIPDSTVGPLGMVRMGLKFLGAYTTNQKGTTESTVPK